MPDLQEYLNKIANGGDDEDKGKKPDRNVLLKFFADNPAPADKKFHKFCEERGWNVHLAEAEAYKMASKFARFWLGGRSNEAGATTRYDPKAIAAGISIEMEHTPDKAVAEKISKDHLAEHPLYYSEKLGLKPMEKKLGVVEKMK